MLIGQTVWADGMVSYVADVWKWTLGTWQFVIGDSTKNSLQSDTYPNSRKQVEKCLLCGCVRVCVFM